MFSELKSKQYSIIILVHVLVEEYSGDSVLGNNPRL